MYVSRAVETIREDPLPDATVDIVLETEDADPETVAAAAEDAGATVRRRLQFDDVLVSAPQERVGELCDINGLAAVQTADAIGIHPDEAEEDVDLDA